MGRMTIKLILAAVLTGVLLGGCASQQEQPVAAAAAPAPDDDAYCRAKGLKVGSDEYVNCRRDRDHVATTMQSQKSKGDLRKIQDYMMDNK